jgi:hypothetical protein
LDIINEFFYGWNDKLLKIQTHRVKGVEWKLYLVSDQTISTFLLVELKFINLLMTLICMHNTKLFYICVQLYKKIQLKIVALNF